MPSEENYQQEGTDQRVDKPKESNVLERGH